MGNLVDDYQKEKWKKARIGLIIFGVIHFFLEAILTETAGSTIASGGAAPVVVNFFISRWFIKDQISKGKEFKNMIVTGLSVSLVVFAIRLFLGFILMYILLK